MLKNTILFVGWGIFRSLIRTFDFVESTLGKLQIYLHFHLLIRTFVADKQNEIMNYCKREITALDEHDDDGQPHADVLY